MRVVLVQTPYHLGHEGVGMGAGPLALAHGAAEALAGEGHEADVLRVTRRDDETNEVGASFAVVRQVAEAVADVLARGAFPLVLAGNCMSSLGTVAALGKEAGVVWFDAHPDFNTTEHSLSGFADGMGLAVLTGTGWRALRETIPGYRSVPERNVVLVGIRDIDPPEAERLDRSGVTVVSPDRVDPDLEGALDALRRRTSDVYLHLDLDVLDPSHGRANEYAAEGGLTEEQVARSIASIGERFRIRAAAVTAYDPETDEDGRIPPLAFRLVTRVAAAAAARAEVAA
jgi:arginase